MHRIPGSQKEDEKTDMKKAPLMFMHGLADSSAAWVVNTLESAPALVAASQGYDVWLGNFRGNKYAKENTKLDPIKNKDEFWDFSFPEMAKYDAVSMIDYVKTQTGYN